MVKKGVSYEEKLRRMLEYIRERKTVFRRVDLEKKLPKAKGIVMQSVKEVLQNLVDDNKVDYDKIGSGNFYWAFPSKASQKLKGQTAALTADLEALEARIAAVEAKIAAARVGREVGSERDERLQKLRSTAAEAENLEEQLRQYGNSNPEHMQRMQQNTRVCVEAANRWTDNVWQMCALFRQNNPSVVEADILKNFGLQAEMDYVQ